MALSLTIGRNSIKICHKEGSRTTVWDVLAEEGEEALIQTFKDVIAFVEGAQAEPGPTAFAALAQAAGVPAEALRREPPTNGWAKFVPPPVPPHLEGEVELIKPGEEA